CPRESADFTSIVLGRSVLDHVQATAVSIGHVHETVRIDVEVVALGGIVPRGRGGTKYPTASGRPGSVRSTIRSPALNQVLKMVRSLRKLPGRFSWTLCGPKRPGRSA